MVADEGPVWALGCMSGTSMDGIDAAALLTDGHQIHGFGPKRFEPFSDADRAAIAAAMGQWDGPQVDAAARVVTQAHGAMLDYFPTVELVGFHGQTLAHDPDGWRTLQVGDGARLATEAGKPVVWDFRTADVLSGGQGAPLVPFFHHACAQVLDLDGPVAFLNIGGVANVTWVNPGVSRPEALGALLAFDTGPGNALIDDVMADRTGAALDQGGALALEGAVDEGIVAEVLGDPYLAREPAKSLDRNHFHWVLERVSGMSTEDAAATLAAITAACVADSIRHMPEPPREWLVAGGGRHNAAILGGLEARSNVPVRPVEAVGLDGDFLEAQAFAYLAVRVLRGLPTSAPGTTGCRVPVCGGRVSLP